MVALPAPIDSSRDATLAGQRPCTTSFLGGPMIARVRLSISLLTAAATAFAPALGRAEGTPVVFLDLSARRADLDAYPWKNRPVLLFAPWPDNPTYVEQRAALHAATPPSGAAPSRPER